jgi:hypothetical protein
MIDPRTINKLFAASLAFCVLAPFALGGWAWYHAPTKYRDLNAVPIPPPRDPTPVVVVPPPVR